VNGVVLIRDILLSGGRLGSKNPSSRRASYSENVVYFMVVSIRAACVNKKEPALPRQRSRDQPDLDALNKYFRRRHTHRRTSGRNRPKWAGNRPTQPTSADWECSAAQPLLELPGVGRTIPVQLCPLEDVVFGASSSGG
jgi:hypothetical protein